MKLGFAAYGHLVDIKGIEELGGVRAENGTLVIGATATHREIERSALVLERLPALAKMEREVANIRVRNVGTLGGNLCFSDPHSDPATFLLALGAEIEYDETRRPLAEFLVGPYETALAQGQLLHSVRIPRLPEGTRIAHRKLSFHERPAATVPAPSAVEDGTIAGARMAVGSVGPERCSQPGRPTPSSEHPSRTPTGSTPPPRSPPRQRAPSRTRTAGSSTRNSSSACWSSAASATRSHSRRRVRSTQRPVSQPDSNRRTSGCDLLGEDYEPLANDHEDAKGVELAGLDSERATGGPIRGLSSPCWRFE